MSSRFPFLFDETSFASLRPRLEAKFGQAVQANGKETWKTPHGFSIVTEPSLADAFVFYLYDHDQGQEVSGCMSPDDLARALDYLERKPDALRKKPDSILRLEAATGATAKLHIANFAKWYLYVEKGGTSASMFNNPMGLSLGYCSDEDHFEILLSNEEEPRSQVHVDKVLALLRKHGLAK